MKIRWYHWTVYRLFWWTWNPILKTHPQMAAGMASHINQWLVSNNHKNQYEQN